MELCTHNNVYHDSEMWPSISSHSVQFFLCIFMLRLFSLELMGFVFAFFFDTFELAIAWFMVRLNAISQKKNSFHALHFHQFAFTMCTAAGLHTDCVIAINQTTHQFLPIERNDCDCDLELDFEFIRCVAYLCVSYLFIDSVCSCCYCYSIVHK